MKPKISIIVPIYNVEKYLNKCIKSILSQEFKDFEVILVNDGSPDNCSEICDDYLLIDNRVKVIHKANGGLSSARNAGLEIAKGDYIGFVDSDDWISKDMYKVLYNLCLENDCEIAECCYKKVYSEENIEEMKVEYDTKILSNLEVLEEMYKGGFAGSTVSWNKLYKKELFKDVRFPQGKLNEDQFTTYKLYYKSKNIVAINRCMYYYYQSNESITRGEFSIKRLDAIEALEDTRNFYKENKLNDLILWHDTLYSFILIKYYFILLEEGKQYDELRKKIKSYYRKLNRDFIKNPYINIKSKYLLKIFNVSPKIYSIIRGM